MSYEVDYRSPAHKFGDDLMRVIAREFKVAGHARESWDINTPDARVIKTAVGGVKFTIIVREGDHR